MSGTAPPSTLARILRVTSPEMMAGALSVLVSVAVLAFVLTLGTGTAEPGGTVISSAPPSDGLIGGAPTGSPTPDPVMSPTATAIATATATGPEAWAPQARVLLEADGQLLEIRDRLASAAGVRPINTTEIARQLRAMNPKLIVTLRLLDGMAANGAPTDLVTAVQAAHSTALDASLETLTASLLSTATYEAGAAEVIGSLSDLEALMARIEGEAGLGPVSSP